MPVPRTRGVAASCAGVPGRFEKVDEGQRFAVVVDYSHTEDALRNADSKNELRLRIKLEGKRESKNVEDAGALKMVEEEQGRSL